MEKKRLCSLLLVLAMLLSLCPAVLAAEETAVEGDVHTLVLSSTQNEDGTWSHTAIYDGTAVTEYDYTWNVDPSEVHSEVKNMPAVYYTGTEPTGEEAVYIAHDIYYYPELDVDAFVLQNYNGEQEWCYYYTAEGYTDYIFSTLPVQGSSVPTQMMHSAQEAYQNAVLHITEPGTYQIEGEWHGQIWIDLGDDAFDDPTAKVTIILNGVDVTCTVAAALVFKNVYECDNTWEDQESWSWDVDTSEAGAVVVLADDTVNNFSGTNIYRLLKTTFKSSSAVAGTGAAQKKYLKIDGTFYSFMSMNIEGGEAGTGVLNVNAGFEGMDSELHLTINGGNVNIYSQDDGMNVNEDDVSVLAVNGGSLHIVAGLGAEGDGIDSNGYLVINGGVVISMANPASDSGLDSDCGSYINGGYVVATGSTMDWAESDSLQVTMNLQFSTYESSDEAIIVTDLQGNVIFAYDPVEDETAGAYVRSYQGAIISCPEFAVGDSYYVYVGGDVTGTEVNGLYDASTVTGFSDEAIQQYYTGTDVGMGFGGMGGGFGDMGAMGGFDAAEIAGEMEGITMQDDGTLSITAEGAQTILALLELYGAEISVTQEDLMACSSLQDVMQLFVAQGMDSLAGLLDLGSMGEAQMGGQGMEPQNGQPEDMGDVRFEMGGEMHPDVQPDMQPDMNRGMDFGTSGDLSTSNTIFYMNDYVNAFSGVSDYSGFLDVAAEDDCYEAVVWALQQGLTTGTTPVTFSPEQICTRAQVVTFLWRAAGSPESTLQENPFTDVDADSYFYQAVLWAYENNIVLGTSADSFSPYTTCSCADAVTFLYRYRQFRAEVAEEDLTEAYYAQAVAWAMENNIAEADFEAASSCTRAQLVMYLYALSAVPLPA